MDETYLIQTAQRGNLDSFNRLVLAYQDMVYAQAYRLMGEPGEAADATQEAFLSAYRKLDGYRGGSFKAWLLRIVTNACYDELRKRKRRPTTPLEPIEHEDDEEIESPRWLTDPDLSPEEQTEMHELDAVIQNCLEDLPVEYRTVVVLVDMQGFDYMEASSVIQAPVGTIKSRLSRARLRLRECLNRAWELLPSKFRLTDEGLSI
jgi:RNA polymerase sigma-70 factor (ECF subfamily)